MSPTSHDTSTPYRPDRRVAAWLVRRRLHALVDVGMARHQIARAAGMSYSSFDELLYGRRACLHWSLATRIFAITGETVRPKPGWRYVPDLGVGRRLRGLLAMGWRLEDLAAAEVDPALVTHTPGWVTVSTHQRVCRLYDELAMRPGPSPKWRDHARNAGCAPPLAWDDDELDRPDAVPDLHGPPGEVIDEVAVLRRVWGDKTVRLTPAEAAEAVRILRRYGLTHTEIERRAGLNVSRYLPEIREVA